MCTNGILIQVCAHLLSVIISPPSSPPSSPPRLSLPPSPSPPPRLSLPVRYFATKFLPAATRFNWYRDSSDWKPFHHDSAAFNAQRAKSQVTLRRGGGGRGGTLLWHKERPYKVLVARMWYLATRMPHVHLLINTHTHTHTHYIRARLLAAQPLTLPTCSPSSLISSSFLPSPPSSQEHHCGRVFRGIARACISPCQGRYTHLLPPDEWDALLVWTGL